MTPRYPRSFAEIPMWAREQARRPTEARLRFAQYAVLRAVTDSRILSDQLVFKGGNALDFIWQPNRSTQDLDFSVRDGIMDQSELRTLLNRALEAATNELGILLRLQRLRQQPPGEGRTFITYQIHIGYALQDDVRNRALLEQSQPSPAIIEVDISLNEPVCEDAFVDVQGTHQLRVSTLEDIVAEKLRALLQQPLRNRTREQDLLDIAIVVRAQPALDREKVGRFLIEKAAARQVPVSRAAFHDPEVARRASQDYQRLRQTAHTFIPLEEALAVLYTFIGTLSIPEYTLQGEGNR